MREIQNCQISVLFPSASSVTPSTSEFLADAVVILPAFDETPALESRVLGHLGILLTLIRRLLCNQARVVKSLKNRGRGKSSAINLNRARKLPLLLIYPKTLKPSQYLLLENNPQYFQILRTTQWSLLELLL